MRCDDICRRLQRSGLSSTRLSSFRASGRQEAPDRKSHRRIQIFQCFATTFAGDRGVCACPALVTSSLVGFGAAGAPATGKILCRRLRGAGRPVVSSRHFHRRISPFQCLAMTSPGGRDGRAFRLSAAERLLAAHKRQPQAARSAGPPPAPLISAIGDPRMAFTPALCDAHAPPHHAEPFLAARGRCDTIRLSRSRDRTPVAPPPRLNASPRRRAPDRPEGGKCDGLSGARGLGGSAIGSLSWNVYRTTGRLSTIYPRQLRQGL